MSRRDPSSCPLSSPPIQSTQRTLGEWIPVEVLHKLGEGFMLRSFPTQHGGAVDARSSSFLADQGRMRKAARKAAV